MSVAAVDLFGLFALKKPMKPKQICSFPSMRTAPRIKTVVAFPFIPFQKKHQIKRPPLWQNVKTKPILFWVWICPNIVRISVIF